ncbi:MAG: prepilin-type N-terminal cleavage/methylation domain-containing protein [Proteobacteria bacterium]|nr:prepilin-type N-terminal cleavage/methylation domain-containing protein [Pseudomonadota bacterium]
MKPERREKRRRGFTLLEMMAVVAMLALLFALVVPRLQSREYYLLRQQAERVVSSLELARQQAVVTGVPHRVLLDLERGGYRVEWYVTEAEAEGLGPEEPGEIGADSPVDMSPPAALRREFFPLPGQMGRDTWLDEDYQFQGMETSDGWLESGLAAVWFDATGTTQANQIHIANAEGTAVFLDVRPLFDRIEVVHADP